MGEKTNNGVIRNSFRRTLRRRQKEEKFQVYYPTNHHGEGSPSLTIINDMLIKEHLETIQRLLPCNPIRTVKMNSGSNFTAFFFSGKNDGEDLALSLGEELEGIVTSKFPPSHLIEALKKCKGVRVNTRRRF